MRKRIPALIMVLVMLISLCACGGSGNVKRNLNIKQNIQDGIGKLSSVENCHLVLRLTVNSQLDLYLDETESVLKAEAGNKDGQRLLEGLELTGLACEDAVRTILSTAVERELLPEGAEVRIDVLASATGPLSPEQVQQLNQAVSDYSEHQAASVDQSVVEAESCGANLVQVENMENGDIFYSYFSNMERIREICYGADGSYHEWVYEDGQTVSTIIVNPDGSRQEEHCTYEDGQVVYHSLQDTYGLEENAYYSDGTQKSHKRSGTDGSVEEQQFYENGNPKTFKTVWSDSSFAEQYFDENGVPTYSYEYHDGKSSERYYYANGNLKTSLDILSDGTVQERQYYENGATKSSRDTSPDGTVSEEYYDEAGNRIED